MKTLVLLSVRIKRMHESMTRGWGLKNDKFWHAQNANLVDLSRDLINGSTNMNILWVFLQVKILHVT